MSEIVLIHGAYQGSWIWKPMAARLRAMGHDVYTPTLDGCAERAQQLRAGITNETHAHEIAELLRCEDLNDAILVGTSTGGMVLCRAAEQARARVARVVFADALALFDGERVADMVSRRNPVTTDFGTGPTHEDARDRLFAELQADTRDWALERYTLHPRAVMEAPITLKSFWMHKWDARVIWCSGSANPPRAHQQRAAARLGTPLLTLDTGHYPMLQAPHELADLIVGN